MPSPQVFKITHHCMENIIRGRCSYADYSHLFPIYIVNYDICSLKVTVVCLLSSPTIPFFRPYNLLMLWPQFVRLLLPKKWNTDKSCSRGAVIWGDREFSVKDTGNTESRKWKSIKETFWKTCWWRLQIPPGVGREGGHTLDSSLFWLFLETLLL